MAKANPQTLLAIYLQPKGAQTLQSLRNHKIPCRATNSYKIIQISGHSNAQRPHFALDAPPSDSETPPSL